MMYDPINNQYVNSTLKLFDFYYTIRNEKPITKYIIHKSDTKTSLFKKKSYKMSDYLLSKESKELENIKKEIDSAILSLSDIETDKWFLYIRDFIYFLKIAEKVYMFDATELDTIVSADIDESLEIYTMKINNDDYEIKFEFQDSSINIPGVSIDISDDDPLGFMKETLPKDEINNVLFINIKVSRKFNNNYEDTYKFIYSSSIPTNDFSDTYLLKVVRRTTSDVTIDIFKYIISNCIPRITGLNRSVWADMTI